MFFSQYLHFYEKNFYFISYFLTLIFNGCSKDFLKDLMLKTILLMLKKESKNIEQGKGIRFGRGASRGGVFDFASANELWRASVEILDFVPLVNASYSGGIIITDWFNGNDNTNRELKITVRFLTNEIRSDALKISVHERICEPSTNKCNTKLIDSKISDEIQLAILKKAAVLEKTKVDKQIEEYRKNNPTGSASVKEGKKQNP